MADDSAPIEGPMADDSPPTAQPIQMPLTPEQQAMVRRVSGQYAEVLELVPDPEQPASGGPLRFLWRISAASGIPRQAWLREDEDDQSSSG